MLILSIETSCDDTSIALVEAGKAADKKGAPVFKVLENVVSSQTEIHRHWGGVVPNLAKREHLKNLPLIWEKIKQNDRRLTTGVGSLASDIQQSKHLPSDVHRPSSDIDLVAATVGPGLEPALWTGIEFAKKLSAELKVPLIGANHLEGHLYSFLLSRGDRRPMTEAGGSASVIRHPSSVIPQFPAVALLVSGGHTMLLLMKDLFHWKKLGETRDDAVGEAFDKVARIMGLPYPGGPEIEKLVLSLPKELRAGTINFPRPMMREKNYEFSFSGLKTSVLYYLRGKNVGRPTTDDRGTRHRSPVTGHPSPVIPDIAASFQTAAIDVLVSKTMRAVREFGAKSVILCGGVAANQALRAALANASQTAGAQFIAPQMAYNSDNAAMVAASAYIRHIRRKKKLPLEANGNMSL